MSKTIQGKTLVGKVFEPLKHIVAGMIQARISEAGVAVYLHTLTVALLIDTALQKCRFATLPVAMNWLSLIDHLCGLENNNGKAEHLI
jgi:hypothetical protein